MNRDFRTFVKIAFGGTENVSIATIYRTCFSPSRLKLWQCSEFCRVLQNQYIGGTEDASISTIYRTPFGPSEL
ncbi:hypothetical protein BpHYR1_006273 [Brachionus plicatilis]|uniref:Uncharacterized protein n=1 Tax=Brachionus plicatilis TaxID=10195 RepID=A0A3M7RBT7_BRAPC|nr:hypothetical protein BpHYR1_006273 [Brachionus plicatilis]